MPKNIVIYSDGTGQDGGVRPEQRVSNVYKLYRATRVHPDNAIDPSEQVCFYDPLDDDATCDGNVEYERHVALLRFIQKANGGLPIVRGPHYAPAIRFALA